MNIGINALSIRNQYAGIGVYTINLIKALSQIDRNNRYVLFLNPENYHGFKVEQDNFENVLVHAPFHKYYIWEQIYLPFVLKKKKIDILHGPRNVLPLLCKIKSVVTIHDLAFLLFPEVMKFNPFNYWSVFVKRSAVKADHIISVSESTKKDIVRLYNISDHKITVTHEACNNSFKRIEDESALKRISQKYELPERFILYVGTIEPRKNLNVVLEAMDILKKNNLNIKLVIVGKKGWLYAGFFDTLQSLGLGNNVIFTGYVPAEDLPGIYNLAEIFVYPSKYEGFGLPLLEAMSCGVPVIASNISSIPEVLGDAGTLVRPDDPKEFAHKIYELLTDKEIRVKMSSKGFERTKSFSWEKVAQKTLTVYENINTK
ncbi:putative mannosyltransferase B [Candidatus Kuenenia stuttgartiensis]|uniref:Putative mannosyltransferase B n=1 Tax=Kuenenia stuttgartiensis TaxID=174633 RepID=Q1Q1X2_KUEST|nr:glycosyltransferase family 1 protein [Candidatus Kuenenia stuttgartiensis]QII11037.1 putative mannosyltransferase B [Candidatus Kuenenia stuttgartiensis]CAJ74004.1 similar to mannosyltransferase B [Candidatus Kuenenia stuttgartiensis]